MSENVEEISTALRRFDPIDFAVFVFMLLVCSFIGLYFGYKDHKKYKADKLKSRSGTEALDYLLGGKNVPVFPVAMSLVASYISGITLLGSSTEIYLYGTQFAYSLIGPTIMAVYSHFVVIPVFYDLKVVSMFEYLQRRFDMRMRLFGSLVSTLNCIMWLPIVIYVPALAFNQTTGIDIHVITPLVMSVCVFYTFLGGIKAVIWTDVFQILIMFGVVILIVIKGTLDVGGLGVLLERNWDSGRIEAPDIRFDPTIRHSFWTVVIGCSSFYIVVNTNQTTVQRFLALKDVKTARKASLIYVIAITILTSLCMYNGLLLFATYFDCDPLTTGLAKAKDQLVPLLVMQTLKDIAGLPGLFIAGVFSAALSSLSSGLNSMSAIVLEDYFKPFFKQGISERASSIIMRGTVLVLGILSVALVYVVQHLGPVLQLSMSIPSTASGSLFATFMIGMFMPWIGKKATFYGAVAGSLVMLYIVVRFQLDMINGLINYETKITSVDGCEYNFTMHEKAMPVKELEREFHHISYLYYMPLGAIITCAAAVILSFFFGFEDPNNVDPRLLAPIMRKYFSSRDVGEERETEQGLKEAIVAFEMKENVKDVSEYSE